MTRSLFHTSSAVLFVAVLASAAGASQIPAAADATITTKKAGKNSGGGSTLVVDAKSNALLRFDISDLPAGTTSGQVRKATLRLWVRSNPKPGSIAVGIVSGGWDEELVTAQSAPGFLPTGVTSILPTKGKTTLSLDVTDVVRSWVAGAPNNGLLIAPEVPGNALKVVFDSRESQTGHAPTLDIEVDRVSVFRTFTINIPAASWDVGYHYGDNNIYRGFELTPALTGGIDLNVFHSQGGIIQVYASTSATGGYSETKALPYIYSSGPSPYKGVRIEYLATRRTVAISKTTNGWDALNLSASELPSNVQVRVTLIGYPQ